MTIFEEQDNVQGTGLELISYSSYAEISLDPERGSRVYYTITDSAKLDRLIVALQKARKEME